jgi:hypothetical protein
MAGKVRVTFAGPGIKCSLPRAGNRDEPLQRSLRVKERQGLKLRSVRLEATSRFHHVTETPCHPLSRILAGPGAT